MQSKKCYHPFYLRLKANEQAAAIQTQEEIPRAKSLPPFSPNAVHLEDFSDRFTDRDRNRNRSCFRDFSMRTNASIAR